MSPYPSNFAKSVVVLTVLLAGSFCRADGLIIIQDPPAHVRVAHHFPFAPLEVTYHHVDVSIDNTVAVTSIDQEFYNPNGARLEGTYIFPLPTGAHIDKFAMDIDGRMAEAELLSAEKARSLYEEIVRKQRDPALLEYVGRDAFKVRIFPIEPNSKKHIQIKYTQLLKTDAAGANTNLTEYTYPLSTEKFSSRPLRDVSIKVTLACKQSLKSIYSPSHNVEIKRDGDHRAVIGYEDRNVRPDTDFKLLFSSAKDPVGMELLTYRDGSDNGYFLLLASPGTDVAATAIQPKDVCFVLDTSGSMAGAKLDQAKKALNFCLANLNEADRFNIIRFATETESLFDELQPVGKENLDRATNFVKGLKPIGGTAIYDALTKALAHRRSAAKPPPEDYKLNDTFRPETSRPYVIIFLTDGLPTVGKTKEDDIVALASHSSDSPNTRIFTFGLGTDVNTHLLDRLANDTKAVSQYVLPNEDIEVKVSSFYSKIQSPVLTDIRLSLADDARVRFTQLYPPSMPDLFRGDTLMIFGRYTLDRDRTMETTLNLKGKLNGEERSFSAPVTLTARDTANAFIPRLWATRRVGWLLDEIRLHGETAELKDEVTKLAREFGIVTPYTAYLIFEDERKREVPITLQNMRELGADGDALTRSRGYYDSAKAGRAQEKSGERAVANSSSVNSLKFSHAEQQAQSDFGLAKGPAPAATPALTDAPVGYRAPQNYAQQAKVVNGRAFYQNGQTWTDSTAQSKKNLKQQQIKFNSDEYFTLLKNHPEAAVWLSLGSDIDIVLDDAIYQIRS